MKTRIEDILDEALDQLKSGASMDAVLFNFAEHKEDLLPLLQIMQPGINLPVKEVPKPALQRKYLTTEPNVHFWNKYFSFTKLALMPLAVVLVFAATYTAQASPGQPLVYGLKLAMQKAPLILIRNPDLRASKELDLSEQNLNEAEKFLNSDHNDSSVDANVIANLTRQTSETIASVKDVATAGAISGKNQDLLNKLVVIAQKQDKIVNTVKTSEDEADATTTLEAGKTESTKTVAEVNKIVATVNEQVLANLQTKEQAAAAEKEKAAEAQIKSALPTDKTKARINPITPVPENTEITEPPVNEQAQVSGNFILEYPSSLPQN